MLNFILQKANGQPLRLLCLGAHCDDIEIGCGGMILELLTNKVNIEIHWVIFSSTKQRREEALHSANLFFGSSAIHRIDIHDFRDGYFPYVGAQIKEHFEKLKRRSNPDLILTHYRNDLHQDHRTINELTWNTFRDHTILEYEIPKYDGDFGTPNFFVPLAETTCRDKANFIFKSFASQREKKWFSEELLLSALRLRGMESNAASGFAEAYYCRKAIWGIDLQ
jgi:LmbE family N-acetylglucosaminyl deacetylase